MRYRANRGGHASGDLRDWFEAYIDAGQKIEGDTEEEMVEYVTRTRLPRRGKSLEVWLLGQLWNCTDIMPGHLRGLVEDITGQEHFTYGAAARALMPR